MWPEIALLHARLPAVCSAAALRGANNRRSHRRPPLFSPFISLASVRQKHPCVWLPTNISQPFNAWSRLCMLNISVRSRQIAKGSLFPAGLHSVILTNPPAQYRLIKSSGRPSPLTHPPSAFSVLLAAAVAAGPPPGTLVSVSLAKTLSVASQAFWGGRPRLPWSRRRCELGSERATLRDTFSELLLLLRRPLMSVAAAVATRSGTASALFPFRGNPDLFFVFCFFERDQHV